MDERILFYNRIADIVNGINQFMEQLVACEAACHSKFEEIDRLRQINRDLRARESIAKENYLKQLQARRGLN